MLKSLINKRFFLTLSALVLIGIMFKLAFWQLDRSHFKATEQARFKQRVTQDIKQMPTDLVEVEDWSYFRVTVSGEYLSDNSFFVDNVVHQSVTGLAVVTPLQIENSDTLILVNRGWLPWGADRTFLPTVETTIENVELTGLLIPASEGHFYLHDPDESTQRSNLWLRLDLQLFEKTIDNPVQSLILILDEGQSGSYENIWQLQDDSWIARHKAYALQWFALALALFLITVILNIKYRQEGAYNG